MFSSLSVVAQKILKKSAGLGSGHRSLPPSKPFKLTSSKAQKRWLLSFSISFSMSPAATAFLARSLKVESAAEEADGAVAQRRPLAEEGEDSQIILAGLGGQPVQRLEDVLAGGQLAGDSGPAAQKQLDVLLGHAQVSWSVNRS